MFYCFFLQWFYGLRLLYSELQRLKINFDTLLRCPIIQPILPSRHILLPAFLSHLDGKREGLKKKETKEKQSDNDHSHPGLSLLLRLQTDTVFSMKLAEVGKDGE